MILPRFDFVGKTADRRQTSNLSMPAAFGSGKGSQMEFRRWGVCQLAPTKNRVVSSRAGERARVPGEQSAPEMELITTMPRISIWTSKYLKGFWEVTRRSCRVLRRHAQTPSKH
jgi:hypothetical protein